MPSHYCDAYSVPDAAAPVGSSALACSRADKREAASRRLAGPRTRTGRGVNAPRGLKRSRGSDPAALPSDAFPRGTPFL